MTTAQIAYDRLAHTLEPLGIKPSSMFGMPVLKFGRKPICGLVSDGVNFKLPVDSPEMKLALSLSDTHLFQPEMNGKKGPIMKQWVVVSPEHEARYIDFAKASIQFVESQE